MFTSELTRASCQTMYAPPAISVVIAGVPWLPVAVQTGRFVVGEVGQSARATAGRRAASAAAAIRDVAFIRADPPPSTAPGSRSANAKLDIHRVSPVTGRPRC